MGGFSAQVQSPQTTGGKGNPISDSQLPPAPTTMDQPQGKGAGGGVGAMAPATYDPSVAQRRFANTSDPGPGGLTILGPDDSMQNNVSKAVRPEAGGPNMQPQGKGSSTNSATSGQPRIGQPNNYANTVGGWDNASIQPQRSGGKGKGY